MKRLALGMCALTASLFASPLPPADAWPDKPIKVIVPFGPGGNTDTLARIIQKAMQDHKLLPQPLTVINVSGKHFSVGAIQAKNAEPDGYTFLLLHIALLSAEASGITKDVGYRDFESVALTAGVCLHPVVMQDSPYKTLKELMAAAKAKPDSLLFGVNLGAINHMAGVYLEQAYPGAKFRFVQIGGGAANFQALKGKQTNVAVISSSEYENFKGGGIRALAYTGATRHPALPDIPTAKEEGLDFTFCFENFWFAPKGTPKVAVDGMAAALEKALATTEVKAALAKQLSIPDFQKGDAFRQYLDATYKSIEPIAKLATKK